MSTPQIKSKIKELQSQVDVYAGEKKSVFAFVSTGSITTKIYIAIPVVIFFLLVVGRPDFITNEKISKEGSTRKFSFKKFIVSWLLISTVLSLGFFGYNYKMKSE